MELEKNELRKKIKFVVSCSCGGVVSTYIRVYTTIQSVTDDKNKHDICESNWLFFIFCNEWENRLSFFVSIAIRILENPNELN